MEMWVDMPLISWLDATSIAYKWSSLMQMLKMYRKVFGSSTTLCTQWYTLRNIKRQRRRTSFIKYLCPNEDILCRRVLSSCVQVVVCRMFGANPNNKVHGTYMGPTWDRQDPGGPHVGPMNLAIREAISCTNADWFTIWPLKKSVIRS